MDNLTAYVRDFSWIITIPTGLMVLIWLFRGRGLRWIALVGIGGFVFFSFSNPVSGGFGGALHQVVNQVVEIVRRIVASLF